MRPICLCYRMNVLTEPLPSNNNGLLEVRDDAGTQNAMSCGICGGQSGTGASSLRVLRFPLPLIHSTIHFTVITIYHPGPIQ
jgi:hypothetical protein